MKETIVEVRTKGIKNAEVGERSEEDEVRLPVSGSLNELRPKCPVAPLSESKE